MAALPRLVQVYGSAAATLAADWYDDLRAEAAVRGRFTVATAELPGTDRTDTLARWAVSPLFAADPNRSAMFTNVSGGLQRIIADADRFTITTSSIEDPKSQGWYRVTGGACSFCQMLAGSIYRTSPEFKGHNHCGCIAAPAF